jgi:hypothetical protein
MRMPLTPEYLWDKLFRVFFLLKWSIFCLCHLLLLVILLFLIWWFQIQPQQVASLASSVLQYSPVATGWLVVSFLGVSGGTILWLYARAWNWAFAKWSNHFMFKKHE